MTGRDFIVLLNRALCSDSLVQCEGEDVLKRLDYIHPARELNPPMFFKCDAITLVMITVIAKRLGNSPKQKQLNKPSVTIKRRFPLFTD